MSWSECYLSFFSLSGSVPLRAPELSLTSRSPSDIQVSWQPLSHKLSRGRVSAYRLSYRTSTDEAVTQLELSGHKAHHLLEGLQPDTTYLLRIAAATSVGWGEPSAWTSHRTPKASSTKGETSIYPSIYLSIYLSILFYRSIILSFYHSIVLSIHPSIHPSVVLVMYYRLSNPCWCWLFGLFTCESSAVCKYCKTFNRHALKRLVWILLSFSLLWAYNLVKALHLLLHDLWPFFSFTLERF